MTKSNRILISEQTFAKTVKKCSPRSQLLLLFQKRLLVSGKFIVLSTFSLLPLKLFSLIKSRDACFLFSSFFVDSLNESESSAFLVLCGFMIGFQP